MTSFDLLLALFLLVALVGVLGRPETPRLG